MCDSFEKGVLEDFDQRWMIPLSQELRRHFPNTRASRWSRQHFVLGRFARSRRLADACDRWAFCSITASPGARCYYDQLRVRGKTHGQALRQLADRWVGILHVCLDRHITYDEHTAWGHRQPVTT